MKKHILSFFLALVTVLGMFPTAAFAAGSEQEALGEIGIYNGGYKMAYLSINVVSGSSSTPTTTMWTAMDRQKRSPPTV